MFSGLSISSTPWLQAHHLYLQHQVHSRFQKNQRVIELERGQDVHPNSSSSSTEILNANSVDAYWWLSVLQSQRTRTNSENISVEFISVAQSCPTLCDPKDCNTPGFPVLHQLPELAQTHVHWVSDAIQPSYLLSSPSPAFNLSQHQGLFQWVSSSHQVARVLEFQLQLSH